MSTLPSSGGVPACPQHPSTASSPADRPTTPAVRRRTRALPLLGVVAAAALVLSACGGQDGHGDSHEATPSTAVTTSAPATSAAAAAPAGGASAEPSATQDAGAHNDADIAFAEGMIVHHRGAIEMSALAADRAGSDAVRELADRIEAAQTPEIDLMTGWLQSWSAPVPTGSEMSGSQMDGSMDHGSMDHDAMGMMSAQDMAALESASGADFDRRFLQSMIVHHEGAVSMSQAELDNGRSPDALTLAQTIIDSQNAEIAEMRGLLASA